MSRRAHIVSAAASGLVAAALFGVEWLDPSPLVPVRLAILALGGLLTVMAIGHTIRARAERLDIAAQPLKATAERASPAPAGARPAREAQS